MKRLFMWTAAGTVAYVCLFTIGCYKGTPPCNPGTVDYPRCDPTQPPWGERANDGGRE